MAWHFAQAWKGRTLCLEVRRDLVADPFDPSSRCPIGADKVRAPPSPRALRRWWP